ncbi:MAG: hypothetical protein KY468_05165 [Armatimonadetes bacterium]|nr:hypothetical protein [Armatimonadota bacterium]
MAYSPTPEWAHQWTRHVAQLEGKDNLPTITWLQSNSRRGSSGHFKYKRNVIHISAGVDLADQQYVLLHELAHWAVGGHYHHNRLFFQKLWDLCPLFDISTEYAMRRDGSIYSGCVREALKRGLIDPVRADAALAHREAILEARRKRAARRRRKSPLQSLLKKATPVGRVNAQPSSRGNSK